MAASKAIFDIQHYANRAAGRPAAGAGYAPAPLSDAIGALGSEPQGIRHMVAATLLGSRLDLTASQIDAVLHRLTPEVLGVPGLQDTFLEWHRTLKAHPGNANEPVVIPQNGAVLTLPAWIPWEIQTQVTHHAGCTDASAWARTTKPFSQLAPRMDPQDWDVQAYLIDEAFALHGAPDCASAHAYESDGRVLAAPYTREPLHERVSAEVPGLSDGLACDLIISFKSAHGAPAHVPNMATYELGCNHEGVIRRNEGSCYVKDEGPGRLVFVSKFLCFNDDAPAALPAIAPVLLPLWLKIVVATVIL